MKKSCKESFKLGTYQLGYEWIDVRLDPTSGDGSVTWDSTVRPKMRTTITVGIHNKSLWKAYDILTHEVMEEAAMRLRLRYKHTDIYGTTSDSYSFHMNHEEFTQLASHVGAFICELMKDFNKAWKRCHRHGK